MMREEIIKAAIACDYGLLQRLATDGAKEFNYSLGEASRPGDYWRDRERDGDPTLATLIRMLARLHAETTDGRTELYVWPAAAGENPTDEDWASLERGFGEETVSSWRTPTGYVGPRVVIAAGGDWLTYIDGD